jgi:hypothetical protein
MNRRGLLFALLGICPLQAISLLAQDHGHGNGNGHGNQDHGPRGGRDSSYFRPEDYGPVRRYYNGPRDLPPGLRKKYYRTGRLPPGWEKKMQPFPPELVRLLPPVPPNCERGYIDGVAIVYNRTTRVILDSLDLINAATGR